MTVVGTIMRVYLGWRLLRLLRPLLAAGLIAGALLALQAGHAHVNRSGAGMLQRGAVAATQNLSRALQRGFESNLAQP